MKGIEINLSQMLARRETRAKEQKLFLEKYNSPLISFCMNIPGPIKTNKAIRNIFTHGKNLLLNALKNINAEINQATEFHEDTGDELLLSVKNIAPEKLKDIAMKIENDSKIGRLYDIDIIDTSGNKLSRKFFRKCLICDKQAQECARSRNHTVLEMQNAVENLISNFTQNL